MSPSDLDLEKCRRIGRPQFVRRWSTQRIGTIADAAGVDPETVRWYAANLGLKSHRQALEESPWPTYQDPDEEEIKLAARQIRSLWSDEEMALRSAAAGNRPVAWVTPGSQLQK